MIIGISGLTLETRFFGLFRRRGNSGAGKDEAAKQLIKMGFVPVAFADPLKRILREVYDFSDEQLWGPSEMRNKPDPRYPQHMSHGPAIVDLVDGRTVPHCLTPRYALQKLGDEWGRGCYRDTWADYAMRVAKKLGEGGWGYDRKSGLYEDRNASPRDVVITDLRYQNEALAIRNANGFLVRCKRFIPKLKLVPDHPSEVDLLNVHDDDFDWLLHNRSTLDDLWSQVEHMAHCLPGSR